MEDVHLEHSRNSRTPVHNAGVLQNEKGEKYEDSSRTYHDYHRVNTVHLRNDKNDLGTQTLLEREKGAAESVYYSHDGVNDDPLFNFSCKNCDGFEVSVEYIILDCVIFLAPIFLFCTHSTGGQRNSIVFA